MHIITVGVRSWKTLVMYANNALVSLVLMDFSRSKSLNQPTLLSLNTSFFELLVVTSFPKPVVVLK